jgi:hypothetical protein
MEGPSTIDLVVDDCKVALNRLLLAISLECARGFGEEAACKVRKSLEYELCKLTNIAVPEAPRKMGEIIFVHEENAKIASEEKMLAVYQTEKGADIFYRSSGAKIEHKQSRVKKSNNYKCNINWPFPKHPDVEERRKLMLETVKEKTEGGEAILQMRSATEGDVLFNEYRLSHAFLMAYFEDLSPSCFPTTSNMNWGCARCKTCLKYHRLEAMKRADDVLTEITKDPEEGKEREIWWRANDSSWRTLVEGFAVPSQCGF